MLLSVTIVTFCVLAEGVLCFKCKEEHSVYLERFGYSDSVTCENMNDTHLKELEKIAIDNLTQLGIYNSKLTGLSAATFKNFRTVKLLKIVNSTLEFADTKQAPFLELSNLRSLILNNTNFQATPQSFVGLEKLQHLSLVEFPKELKKEALQPLKHLEILTLSKNNFNTLWDIPFCNLTNLLELHLDHNQIEAIDGSFPICNKNKKQPIIKINDQHISVEDPVEMESSALRLATIDLSFNRISKIESFDWAVGIKNINLKSNLLTNLDSDLFSWTEMLETLNFESNLLDNLDKNCFAKLKNLKTINLKSNHLKSVYLENLFDLEQIYLSHNQITTVVLKNFNLLPKLKLLHLDDNNITGIDPEFFKNIPVLNHLDLSDNHAVLSTHQFIELRLLQKLYLRNNSISSLPSNLFQNLTTLEVLDLSENSLRSLDPDSFSDLASLQILNLSCNHLEHLEDRLLKPLQRLNVFDVSHNRLFNLDAPVFSFLPALQVLNVSSNSIPCISRKDISYFRANKVLVSVSHSLLPKDQIICKDIKEDTTGGLSVGVGILIAVCLIIFGVILSVFCYTCLGKYRRRRGIFQSLELRHYVHI